MGQTGQKITGQKTRGVGKTGQKITGGGQMEKRQQVWVRLDKRQRLGFKRVTAGL